MLQGRCGSLLLIFPFARFSGPLGRGDQRQGFSEPVNGEIKVTSDLNWDLQFVEEGEGLFHM